MNTPGINFYSYKGNEPYLFISYAHKDSNLVYPIINDLNDKGYNIWYDEGIDPGNEWPDEIASALEKCTFFIVFISNNSAQSKNVINEINFALDENKPLLAIHIEETILPAGLRLRIGSTQAIMKYRMENEVFDRKISLVLNNVKRGLREVRNIGSDFRQLMNERIEATADRFHMAIEDVFYIKGRGAAVTGIILSGKLAVGDIVEIVGLTKEVKKAEVKGIEMSRKLYDKAKEGDNVGILLGGINENEVQIGQVLTTPNTFKAYSYFNAEVYLLSPEEGGNNDLINNSVFRFWFRTFELNGVIKLLPETKMIVSGKVTTVTIKLASPVAMLMNTQFAIREEKRIIGIGFVTNMIE